VSKNKKVVVIGTEATVSSHAYRRALEARGVEAREKACPLLVPLVEEGWVEHAVTEEVARIYLRRRLATASTMRMLWCWAVPTILCLSAAASRGAVACEHCRLGGIDGCVVSERLQELLPPAGFREERRALPRIKFFATIRWKNFAAWGSGF